MLSTMLSQPLSSYDQSSCRPPSNYPPPVRDTFIHFPDEAQGRTRLTKSVGDKPAATQDVSEMATQAQPQERKKAEPESSDDDDEGSLSEKAEVSPKFQTEVQGEEAGAVITNAQGSVHPQHAAGPPPVSVDLSVAYAISNPAMARLQASMQTGPKASLPISDDVWQKRREKRRKWFPKFRTSENQNFEKDLPGYRRPPSPDPNDRDLSPADWEKQTAELRQYWAMIDVIRFLVQEVDKWKGVTNEQDRKRRQALLKDSENAWQEVTQEQKKPNKSGKNQKQAPITHDECKKLALARLRRKYFPLDAI